MRRLWALGLGVALTVGGGCNEGADSTAPLLAPARLDGQFRAQSAVVTAADDPGLRLDVISQDGQFRFTLDEGRFSSRLTVPGRPDVVRAGSAVIVGDRLMLADDGAVARVVPFTFDDGLLRLRDSAFGFDFEGVGVTLPAVLDVELVRVAR